MKKFVIAALATAPIAFGSMVSQAATIDPNDFDTVISEATRTVTVDGTDVSGVVNVIGNPDIISENVGSLRANDDVLLLGRIVEMRTPTSGFADEWTFSTGTASVEVSVINFAESTRFGVSPFTGLFELLIDDVLVDSFELTGSDPDVLMNNSFATIDFVKDSDLTVRITAVEGRSDYDIAVNASFAVPLPATLPLFLGGLLGLAYVARRRAA
ncbi:MAG: hypothetical protein AAGF44_00200 [Pseudomonadota bacterium]